MVGGLQSLLYPSYKILLRGLISSYIPDTNHLDDHTNDASTDLNHYLSDIKQKSQWIPSQYLRKSEEIH